MGVGAAGSEGGHSRAPGSAGGTRPFHGPREQLHRSGGPVHMGRRTIDVQSPGHRPVAHCHDHLDQAADACCRLRVADVRLQRPQPQRPVGVPVLPVGGEHRLRLDRIAERGAGTVGLDHVDIAGLHAGVGQRGLDDVLLGGSARCGQSVGRPVLVDRRASDQRPDAAAVAARVGEPFQHQDPGALGEAGAVGVVGERLAPAVRRQAPLP